MYTGSGTKRRLDVSSAGGDSFFFFLSNTAHFVYLLTAFAALVKLLENLWIRGLSCRSPELEKPPVFALRVQVLHVQGQEAPLNSCMVQTSLWSSLIDLGSLSFLRTESSSPSRRKPGSLSVLRGLDMPFKHLTGTALGQSPDGFWDSWAQGRVLSGSLGVSGPCPAGAALCSHPHFCSHWEDLLAQECIRLSFSSSTFLLSWLSLSLMSCGNVLGKNRCEASRERQPVSSREMYDF